MAGRNDGAELECILVSQTEDRLGTECIRTLLANAREILEDLWFFPYGEGKVLADHAEIQYQRRWKIEGTTFWIPVTLHVGHHDSRGRQLPLLNWPQRALLDFLNGKQYWAYPTTDGDEDGDPDVILCACKCRWHFAWISIHRNGRFPIST